MKSEIIKHGNTHLKYTNGLQCAVVLFCEGRVYAWESEMCVFLFFFLVRSWLFLILHVFRDVFLDVFCGAGWDAMSAKFGLNFRSTAYQFRTVGSRPTHAGFIYGVGFLIVLGWRRINSGSSGFEARRSRLFICLFIYFFQGWNFYVRVTAYQFRTVGSRLTDTHPLFFFVFVFVFFCFCCCFCLFCFVCLRFCLF